jgi:hypothetical protein
MRIASIALGLLLTVLPARGAVDFATPPRAQRTGDGLVVSFTLSERSDVEVAILNADGRVVRHLAAGVLGGEHDPPAPLKPGFAQRIVWDGKDDLGQPAPGGPFKVRVRAGMSVQFGRMIGGSPYTGSVTSMPYRAPVNGLAVDGEGNLYVKMMSSVGSHGNSGLWPWHVRRFDRNGKYGRTIMPYPPSTPAADATGYDLIAAGDGRLTPANRTSLYPVFAALGNEIVPRLADGRMVFVHTEKRQLNFLSLDGRNRVRTVTMWPAKAKLNCPTWLDIQVALSPDGRYAYYSNVAGTAYDGKTPSDIDPVWPQGRIYRQDLTDADATPQPFFDLKLPDFAKAPYWMPSAWDKKTAAAGIDTDAKGNVLVCDLVNHEVVEVSPGGVRLSATKFPWPDKVMVSRKTDDLYVVSRKVSRGNLPPATLFKVHGRGENATVAARLQLPGTVGGAFTLDQSGDKPVLWLAGGDGETEKLFRIEDRGNELTVTGDNYLNRDTNAIAFVGYMDVDREAELVYVTSNHDAVWRYNGDTGEGGRLPIRAVDLAIGPGGDIYAWGSGGYQGPVTRYTRGLDPAPLPGAGTNTYGNLYGRAGRGHSVCGMDVDGRGRVYATWGVNECHVRVYDADGTLVTYPRTAETREEGKKETTPAAISGVVGYGGSIRVDPAGNIYLLQAGVPDDFPAPPGFEHDEAFHHAMGTIYKFPPTGGSVRSRNGTVLGVDGAVAAYAGCGPVSRWNAVGSCACTKPRFDVDGFGRLYIPNAITFSVSVRDNADNEIARFGGYGNYDCQGPGSAEPPPGAPAIPLGWPVTAGASGKAIYVGDTLNHRVVRVDKKWAAERVVGAAE